MRYPANELYILHVVAPGLGFSMAGGLNYATADAITDRLSDEELRGGVFTLAVHDAEECGAHLTVDIQYTEA